MQPEGTVPPYDPASFDQPPTAISGREQPPGSGAAVAGAGPPSSSGPEDSAVQSFFLSVCVFAMAMLVMIPIWNSVTILHNPAYVHLMGISIPTAFIICTLLVVAGFVAVILLFFQVARPEVQTGQTMVMIVSSILTLLGITFMLFGHGLKQAATEAAVEVKDDCYFGPDTAALYRQAEVLYAVRLAPGCVGVESVEHCPGFEATYEARVLKAIERDFRCSTFCNDAKADGTLTPVPTGGWPTLFSNANYQASCQMMLWRNLNNYVGDVAIQAHGQGCVLVFAAAMAGFLKVLGFCSPFRPRSKVPAEGYGSTASSRYVSGGIIL